MNDCNKCVWARRDGGCNSWDCIFIDQDEAANAYTDRLFKRVKESPVMVLRQPERKKMSNKEWIDFLSEQFTVSRTTAREMLHSLMKWKAEDNFKKEFSRRKDGEADETDRR